MKHPLFEGISTAMVTPFENGKVSISMLHRLLDRQMEAGIRSFVICGTTGEAPTLSDGEKVRLFQAAKSYTGADAVILAGTGSNSTAHAVRLSKEAQQVGADGLLAVSPYYNKATAQGLIRHYTAIAQAVTIPVILYNVPSRTGVDIPVSVYRELSGLPNILGVKEASPDLRKIAEIRRICPEDFYCYSGNDDLTIPVLALGGKGVVSVVSNVAPGKMKKLYDDVAAGDLKKAQADFMELLPLMEALFSEVNPIPVKAAMKLLGFDCGGCRLPLTDPSPEHLQQIQGCLG